MLLQTFSPFIGYMIKTKIFSYRLRYSERSNFETFFVVILIDGNMIKSILNKSKHSTGKFNIKRSIKI